MDNFLGEPDRKTYIREPKPLILIFFAAIDILARAIREILFLTLQEGKDVTARLRAAGRK